MVEETELQTTGCSSTGDLSRVSEGTRSDEGSLGDLTLYGEWNPLVAIVHIMTEVKDPKVSDQLKRLLLTTCKAITLLSAEAKSVLAHGSRLEARLEGDSVVLEWIFPDFRVGFNVESNPDESGWCILSNKKLGEITVSSRLGNIRDAVMRIFAFIGSNV